MFPVEWCNLCQTRPATGILSGYFADLKDEPLDLRACTECAEEALDKGKTTQ